MKNPFKKFFNKTEKEVNLNTMNFSDFFNNGSKTSSNVVYYVCLKTLSESLGKLSIHLKDKDNKKITDHETYIKLKYKPNEKMNATIFKTLIEYQRNHFGNAYVYIKYGENHKLQGLYPLEPTKVKIWVDNANLFGGKIIYEYEKYFFKEEEILHLKGGLSADGVVGISVREKLASTLNGVEESQEFLNRLYKRGLTAKGILRYTGDLNKEKQLALLEKINAFLENPDSNRLGLLPLPPGMDVVPLDLKLTDSQFFELKKFSALQVASAFGVKPNQLNDYEKSSYANSEMQNLAFYIDTLLYILSQWEEELTYKLLTTEEIKQGLQFEFNVAGILKGDLKTQAECITKYLTSGVYTINESRGFAGLEPVPNGDVIVMNGSYVPLEKIGAAYKKGGDKDE